MTEIVRYEPPTADLTPMQQAADYHDWAPKLQSAAAVAREICQTDFVPGPLRGKPAAVTAAILAGSEMNLGPMASLMHVHIIDGRPSLSAEMARSLVLSHGHHIRYREMTTTRCAVDGRRRGEDDWTTVTWTMDDAQRAGLHGRTNWKRYPRRMLAARATGELCRLLFSDALAGMPYVSEELEDDSDDVAVTDAAQEQQPPKRTAKRRTSTKATKAKAEKAEPAPDLKPEPTAAPQPPLPGEDDTDDTDDGEQPPITPAQLTKLQTIFTEHNIGDRDARLRIAAQIVGRTVSTSKDLTLPEAGTLIDTLERCANTGDFGKALGELLSSTNTTDDDETKDKPEQQHLAQDR